MLKVCSKCKEPFEGDLEYLESKFNAHPQTTDGLRPECKTCEADAKSVYYLNNWQTISDKRYERLRRDPDYAKQKREYDAQKKREQRARQREQMAASA